MLIRSLYGQSLTNLVRYSMMLSRQPVDIHFSSNFKLARQRIQKLTTQHKMTKQQGRKFFSYFPKVFKQNSTQYNKFIQRIELVNKIASEEGKRGIIGKVLKDNLFRTNHLAFDMSQKQINDLVNTVDKYFCDNKQIQTIFNKCPNLINGKFTQIFIKKLQILTDYLQITNQQAMKLFQASPFLIPTSERKLRQSLVTLSRKFNMNKEQLIKLMNTMGEVFLLGGPNLSDIHKTPASWGLNSQQIKQAFLNHPLLFFNYPYNVMPFKLKIIKHMNFTVDMGKKIFRDYPQILIWSIRSLEQKAIFIMNRLQLKIDEDTMQLLKFNFNKTLRPRGEILIRSKKVYDKSNIVSFMQLSDQEFMKKVEAPIQKLKQQKDKYPPTRQMDFKRSKVISYIGAKEKFMRLASAYDS